MPVKPRAMALWLSHLAPHRSVSPGTEDRRPMLARLLVPSEPCGSLEALVAGGVGGKGRGGGLEG